MYMYLCTYIFITCMYIRTSQLEGAKKALRHALHSASAQRLHVYIHIHICIYIYVYIHIYRYRCLYMC